MAFQNDSNHIYRLEDRGKTVYIYDMYKIQNVKTMLDIKDKQSIKKND